MHLLRAVWQTYHAPDLCFDSQRKGARTARVGLHPERGTEVIRHTLYRHAYGCVVGAVLVGPGWATTLERNWTGEPFGRSRFGREAHRDPSA